MPSPTDQQPPAHHYDPDMSEAVIEAMLLNPHHADAIAGLSDDELDSIAEQTPLHDDSDDEPSEPME